MNKARYGSTNGSWKGGKTLTKDGYVMVRFNGYYVLEHRLKMMRSLKRKLREQEIVHHINGVKHDNRITNLKLCTKRSHRKEHTIDTWTKKYSCCIRCGRSDRDHASSGYCTTCNAYLRSVKTRGYECAYKNGKRIFSEKHRQALSQAMKGNTNGSK